MTRPGSLTAFVAASVARAAAAPPDVHAYRDWRGQLVTHSHVDVVTMAEFATPQGPFGLPYVLRDADIRRVPELTAELHRVKRDPSTGRSSRWWVEQAAPIATRVFARWQITSPSGRALTTTPCPAEQLSDPAPQPALCGSALIKKMWGASRRCSHLAATAASRSVCRSGHCRQQRVISAGPASSRFTESNQRGRPAQLNQYHIPDRLR
jgi:hypothetical protein